MSAHPPPLRRSSEAIDKEKDKEKEKDHRPLSTRAKRDDQPHPLHPTTPRSKPAPKGGLKPFSTGMGGTSSTISPSTSTSTPLPRVSSGKTIHVASRYMSSIKKDPPPHAEKPAEPSTSPSSTLPKQPRRPPSAASMKTTPARPTTPTLTTPRSPKTPAASSLHPPPPRPPSAKGVASKMAPRSSVPPRSKTPAAVGYKEAERTQTRARSSSNASTTSTSAKAPAPIPAPATVPAPVPTPTTAPSHTAEKHKEEIAELHGRIEELQAAMATMKFERDSLLLHNNNTATTTTTLHSGTHIIEAADTDTSDFGSEVGSVCSWDSMMDDRDERYNELLKRHMKVMSDLAEKVGMFKSVLLDARTEYEELLTQHQQLQITHEHTVTELECVKLSMGIRHHVAGESANGLSSAIVS